jgi:hypothetical protein
MLEGALILLAGILIGWVARSLPARRKDPKPVEAGYEHKPCACRRYSGPEPMPTYYAPEIAGEAG